MNIATIKKLIVPILKRQGVVKASIFGSFSTGKAKKNSDIDLLVKFKKTIGLFELSQLKIQLEEKTQRKVDLLTYNSINPLLKDRILNEQTQIYEKRS